MSPAPTLCRIRLSHPDDAAGVLDALGGLLRDGIEPSLVDWDDGWSFSATASATATASPVVTQRSLFEEAELSASRDAPPSGSPAPDTGSGHNTRRAVRDAQSTRRAVRDGHSTRRAARDGHSTRRAARDGHSTCAARDGLPAPFIALLRDVVAHDDHGRFELLHRYALQLGADPRRWHDRLSAERVALERMAGQVRHELHRMHAFVRFRRVDDDAVADAVADAAHYAAWFEPAHHIVRRAAPFFQARFASMRWSILTPRGSLHWDRERLQFAPAADRAAAPKADAGEAMWLAYYRSIFNPARANAAALRNHMPVRFWRNLPEAREIPELLRSAPSRVGEMTTTPVRETPQRSCAAAPHAMSDGRTGDPGIATNPLLDTLATLRQRLLRCRDCAFADDATQTVCGEGPLGAPLMLVGEQPGDQEDLAGRPFVGPAGKLLMRALQQLGWPREALFLTNAVKHFKFAWADSSPLSTSMRGKRRLHKTAAQREVEACAGWLEAEIRAVAPRAIVALGAVAARSLLTRATAATAREGDWLRRADGLPVLVVRHPAALLRSGAADDPDGFARWVAALARATHFVVAAPPLADMGPQPQAVPQ